MRKRPPARKTTVVDVSVHTSRLEILSRVKLTCDDAQKGQNAAAIEEEKERDNVPELVQEEHLPARGLVVLVEDGCTGENQLGEDDQEGRW